MIPRSPLRIAIPPVAGFVAYLAGLGIVQQLIERGPTELPIYDGPEDPSSNARFVFYLLHDVGTAIYATEGEVNGHALWWTFDYRSRTKTPQYPTEPDVWFYLTPSVYRNPGGWPGVVAPPEIIPSGALVGIPFGLLLLAGAITALVTVRTDHVHAGMLAGASIAIGYLIATIVGLQLEFVWLDSTIRTRMYIFPDPIVSIVRMGIAYPIMFGGLGGATAVGLRRLARGRG